MLEHSVWVMQIHHQLKQSVFSPGVGHFSPQSSHAFVVFIFSTQFNLKDAL